MDEAHHASPHRRLLTQAGGCVLSYSRAVTGMFHPYGQIFFDMRLPLLLQRQKADAAIRKIHSWQPQHILLSHGRCFDADADKVIRRIFGEPPR